MKCTRCPSYAINPNCDEVGRDRTRLDLCDVCWWRNRAEKIEAAGDKLAERHLLVPTTYPQAQAHVAEYNREKGEA
jgi:hypothetical protein